MDGTCRRGLMCLLKYPRSAHNATEQLRSSQHTAVNSSTDDWCDPDIASPDSCRSYCSCSTCCYPAGCKSVATPSSLRSSLDWELDIADEQLPVNGKDPDAAGAGQHMQQYPQLHGQHHRRQAPPCLQVPCPHDSPTSPEGTPATATPHFGPLSQSTYMADCATCSPDVRRGSSSKAGRALRRHSHAKPLQEHRQQQDDSWPCDVEGPCPRMHSAPAALPASVSGQHTVPLPVVPPAAFKTLAPYVAAAMASSPECNQQQYQLGSMLEIVDAMLPGSPQGACSHKQTQLLVVPPSIPADMQRSRWCLAEFWISQRLYKGFASSVYHAIDRQTNRHVALKVYHTGRLQELNRYQVLREVYLHAHLQHINIIQMYAAFQEDDDVVMVLEYASGGDLYNLLRQAGGRLPEQQAVELVLQPFLSALAYMHSKGIVHRDIKPENVLLTADGTLKIADFGLAIDLNQERAVTRAGTLDYMAPEVLRCPVKEHPLDYKHCHALQYNTSVDVWAVGVLAYELLVGFPPFASNCPGDAMHKILACDVVFPKRITAAARGFVQDALRNHPGDRPTITQMSANPWINSGQVRAADQPTEACSSPTAQPLQSGPGFGEAALLRCFLAAQPPSSCYKATAAQATACQAHACTARNPDAPWL